MFKKKIISLILVICLTLSIGIVYASTSDYGNNSHDQKVALDKFKVIMDHNKSKYDTYYPSNYSGAYFDDDNNLNINLVNDSNDYTTELKSLVKDDNIKFHYVKYSLNYLDSVTNILNKHMVEFGINEIDRDEQNNKICVYLVDLNDAQISRIKKVTDSSVIEFKKQEAEIATTATGLINGTWLSGPGAYGAFTLGFGAKLSNGTIGYVIPGHILPAIGTNIYLGSSGSGTSIGTVSSTKCSGATDASFVKTNANYVPTKNLGLFDNYTSTTPVMYGYPTGTGLTAWGAKSGKKGGSIVSSSASVYLSEIGVTLTDQVKSTYVAVKGDSGAPVCIGSSSFSLCGMQSSSILVNNNWVPGTSYSFFTKLGHITVDLGLSTYP